METIRLRIRELLAEREAHEKRRIRLGEIAKATGIATSTLSGLINGRSDRLSLKTLGALCRYFRCVPGSLFEYKAAGEGPLEVDARDIVDRWEREYGSDEFPRA
jgi:putative transcriptional regulator